MVATLIKGCQNLNRGGFEERKVIMKKPFIVVLIIVGGVALIVGQPTGAFYSGPQLYRNTLETNGSSYFHSQEPLYDKKTPPNLSLSDAYALALAKLGSDTNQYYCISATCLEDIPVLPNEGMHVQTGWTLDFSNTNGIQKRVFVYFDKAACIDNGERERNGVLF
jgi:hypothetical protein